MAAGIIHRTGIVFISAVFPLLCLVAAFCPAEADTLTGRVMDGGTPVPGAAVYLCAPETDTGRITPAHETITGEDGRFSIVYDAPETGMIRLFPTLFAVKAGYAVGISRPPETAGNRDIAIHLAEAGTITGAVTDESGSPVPDATVTPLFPAGSDIRFTDITLFAELPGTNVRSDADGGFVIGALPTDIPLAISVSADGYAKNQWDNIRAGQRDFPFTLPQEGHVSGRVTIRDTGEPAVGVTVRLRSEKNISRPTPFTIVTDNEGRYLITGVEPGMYSLDTLCPTGENGIPDFTAPLLEHIEVEPGATSPGNDIVLPAGVIVTGRASYAGSGEPVAGLLMTAYPRAGYRRSTLTGGDGNFRFRLPAGRIGISANTMNILDDMGGTFRDFTAADGDTVAGIDYVFDGDITATVRVISPDGAPLPFACLYGFPIVDENGEVVVTRSLKRLEHTTKLKMRASREDLCFRGESEAELVDGMVLEVPVERYETAMVKGRVVDGDGRPVSLVRVSVESNLMKGHLREWGIRRYGVTDGRGEYCVAGAVVGLTTVVSAHREGYITGECKVTLSDTAMVILDNIVLEASDGWLEGVVTDDDGVPLTGVRVSATTMSESSIKASGMALTDSRGRYRIEGILPVMGWMQADLDGYPGYHMRNIETSTTRNIILKRPDRWLEGRVVDSGGSPCPGLSVGTPWKEGLTRSAETDDDGRFRLDGLDGLTEYIIIGDGGTGAFHYEFVTTNDTGEFVIPDTDGFLAGTIVGTDNVPVAGASFRLVPVRYPFGRDGCLLWGTEERWETDENGRFRIDGIAGNTVTMEIYHEAHGNITIEDIPVNRDDAVIVMKSEERAASSSAWEFTRARTEEIEGTPAPELTVTHWLGSSPLSLGSSPLSPGSATRSLADFRGNIVVLDFWSTDDPEEANATRQMNALAREYGGKGITVIGIHRHTDDIGDVEAFMREKGLTYPVAIDAPPSDGKGLGATFESYGIRVLNHDVLVTPDGTVHSGIRAASLERELLHLIANR